MPRPNFKFSRLCEYGFVINCPGQFQGVVMEKTSSGVFRSVETDEASTINLTIPRNYTAMFTSATSDRGNTVSGLFDIQYRRWKLGQGGAYDKGQTYVRGDNRYIESLIAQDTGPLLKEGLIVDMTENPGIGFRNHTIPVGLDHGGTWSEDITWIETVTQCADTNLSIELQTEDRKREFFIVDRGAFVDLDNTALESPPWIDNQTLDLFGRAQKAARMHNVLVASSLNVSLPLDPPTKTLPKFEVKEAWRPNIEMFSRFDFDTISLREMSGLGGPPPEIPEYPIGNNFVPKGSNFVPRYSNGLVKLLALNYSAITQICMGYDEVSSIRSDRRANNITTPAVQYGYVIGASNATSTDLSASKYSGVQTQQRKLYVCASGIRTSIKTVDFQYNGPGSNFSNLEVLRITDKVYPNEESKPLWAVEHSYNKRMRFEPLWGIVDQHYEETDGFHTLRAEKLWLPTNPYLTLNFGQTGGNDALAAVSGYIRWLGNLYKYRTVSSDRGNDGIYNSAVFKRFQKLSENETGALLIPSLILTDGLAGTLVGTKTSFSTKHVTWPASLAVDDTNRGFPRARVIRYKRVTHYDLRYAIPGFVVLPILILALIGASGFVSFRSIIYTMQNMFNRTSTGRLITNMLQPGQGNPEQPSHGCVKGDGMPQLSSDHISGSEKDTFRTVVGNPLDAESGSGGDG